MKNQQRKGDFPSTSEIRAALDRVLASPPFPNSPQLLAFLRFVVESALKGEAEQIKSYTIAVEALGRDQSFDPQTDPIVRVEAGRLRRALQHYYAGPGASDPVIIDLPLGGYVPAFRRRTEYRNRPGLLAQWPKRLPIKPLGWLLAAQVVWLFAVGVIVAIDWRPKTAEPTMTETVPPSPSALLPAPTSPSRYGMPVVVVQRINTIASPAQPAIMLDGLSLKLRDALARFDEIHVASELALPVSSPLGMSPRESLARGVYRVSATAEYDKDALVSLSFRLHDPSDGTVIWAQTFANISADNFAVARNEIVQKVATSLAQPYGVIYARERAKLATNEMDPRYRCILEAFEYWRGFDRGKNAGVRACLEHVTGLDPTFAEGFAILGLMRLREYYEPEIARSDTLDLALAAAQVAVELKPQSARAHHALMSALFARGDIAAALAEGEKVMSLNPYDMLVVQAYGMRLVLGGQVEKGAVLLRQVALSSPVRTPKFEFSLFLTEYVLGRDENPVFRARLFTNNDYPLLLVARAVAATRAGAHDQARQAVARLITLHPGWRDDPRARLERYIPASAIVDRLAQDLTAAGLLATH
jgi:TolB-like protein/tetratricopeptide (TPR) repeat protein